MEPYKFANYLFSEILADLLDETSKTYTWAELKERFKWKEEDETTMWNGFTLLRKASEKWSNFTLDPADFVPQFHFRQPTVKQITVTLYALQHGC